MSRRRETWMIVILGVAASVAASRAQPPPQVPLNVETMCRADKGCRVKVTVGDGDAKEIVLTTFRANRVGPDMKYFKGEEYGSADVPGAGLMYLDSFVVLDDTGTMRAPTSEDSPEDAQSFTQTVGIDPQGRVTFFCGLLRPANSPRVERSYLWGYPPTTVKTRGSIGGPRSPIVPRKPAPKRMQQRGTGIQIRAVANAENKCRVTVTMTSRNDQGGVDQGTAVTHFRANRLGEDMRYFPREREGGGGPLAPGHLYYLDLDVVLGDSNTMRPAGPGDAPEDIDTMTTAVALDERGHVTFFYGFVRVPNSSYVRRFYLWGYPPGTLMVDGPESDGVDRAELEASDRSGSGT